jgi:hypothetical protein
MKAERYLSYEATIKKGVDALVRELGPVGDFSGTLFRCCQETRGAPEILRWVRVVS